MGFLVAYWYENVCRITCFQDENKDGNKHSVGPLTYWFFCCTDADCYESVDAAKRQHVSLSPLPMQNYHASPSKPLTKANFRTARPTATSTCAWCSRRSPSSFSHTSSALTNHHILAISPSPHFESYQRPVQSDPSFSRNSTLASLLDPPVDECCILSSCLSPLRTVPIGINSVSSTRLSSRGCSDEA